jgi:endonuclease G
MIKKLKLIAFVVTVSMFANSCQKENAIAPGVNSNTPSVTVKDNMVTTVENFESAAKITYAPADLTLSNGTWHFNNAVILGTPTSGNVAHLEGDASLTMNYDVTTGISGVHIDYVKTGTDNSTFELWVSKDGGSHWTQTGDAITASTTVNNVAFYMDYHGNVRLQLRKTGNGGLNVDNLTIEDNSTIATRDNNMAMGNPSNAIANASSPNNYLMQKPQYALGYNSSKGNPKWVSWHLSTAWKGNAPRVDCFRGDETLPAGFKKTSAADYNNIGFDRGHQCPSDDRDGTSADNKNTFYMTDMLPQAPNLNRIVWLALEDYSRTLASQGNELYIISGGYGTGGTGSNGGISTLVANGKVEVPAYCWKVIVVLTNGSNDLGRVNANTRIIAVSMPNNQTVSTHTWGYYRVSVDAIEAATGLNLLSGLSTSLQASKEAVVDNGPTQ